MRSLTVSSIALGAVLAAGPVRAADPIFSPSVLHETRIVIDPSDWQALRANFRSNDYYAANISIDGEVVQQVGIRSRGKGSRSGEKPGLKVDMNRYIKTQEFHGSKSVELLNIVQDQSMLREVLSLAVFQAMGFPTSQIAHTRVTVNDEYWGVYNLKEDVNKPFLQNTLGDKEGNLYKYEYADVYGFSVRGGDGGAYVPLPFEPKTNEDNNDPSALANFVRTVNEAPDAGFAAAVGAYTDVEKFLTYLAVENAVAESDGICGSQGMNNFFLYQLAGTNKFVFIPWDKNTSFQSPSWPLLSNMDQNVLARRLIADPALKQVYTNAVKRTAQSFANAAFLGPRLEAAYNLIRNAALSDTKKPYSNDAFELAVQGLRGIIASREADVLKQAP